MNGDALKALTENGVECATGDNTWRHLQNLSEPHHLLYTTTVRFQIICAHVVYYVFVVVCLCALRMCLVHAHRHQAPGASACTCLPAGEFAAGLLLA